VLHAHEVEDFLPARGVKRGRLRSGATSDNGLAWRLRVGRDHGEIFKALSGEKPTRPQRRRFGPDGENVIRRKATLYTGATPEKNSSTRDDNKSLLRSAIAGATRETVATCVFVIGTSRAAR
jgi:hypothetical protein